MKTYYANKKFYAFQWPHGQGPESLKTGGPIVRHKCDRDAGEIICRDNNASWNGTKQIGLCAIQVPFGSFVVFSYDPEREDKNDFPTVKHIEVLCGEDFEKRFVPCES